MELAASFAQVSERWHDFFLLAGTAAATLMGLLFVALSLHLDVIVQEDGAHFGTVALQAFLNFIFVLLISLFLLIPSLTGRIVGTTLMMLGLVRLALFIRSAAVVGRRRPAHVPRSFLLVRYFMPAVAYVGLFASGLAMTLKHYDDGFMGLFSVMGLLLVTATRTAWDLIVQVGKHKLARDSAAPRA